MSLEWTTGEQLGNDGKEGITYIGTLTRRFNGSLLDMPVQLRKGARVAVKTFRATKSVARIEKEAALQQTCALAGISPPVYGIDRDKKCIVMKMLASLPVQMYREQALPDDLQYQICALMHRLDEAKVMHNDMNAFNVMLDDTGRPFMIDFGLAKPITPKITKKFGAHPNIRVTLWGLVRGFRRNKVECPILNECVKAKDKSVYFEQGESLLTETGHRRKRRKR
ncbi:protein kinase [bacterium]|nr:protein kinase [bacterium]